MMDLERLAALSHKAMLVGFGLLLLSLWLGWWVRDSATALLLAQLLPLLLFLPGAARSNARALIWLCVLLLVYAVKAIMALLGAGGWLTWLEAAAVFWLFFAALYHVRWHERWKKLAAN